MQTERLVLREWRDEDLEPFARMNADPRVMKHFPSGLSREESDLLASRIDEHFATHGFGLWAVEIKGIVPFAGFIGLAIPRFEAHFTPCVEIGWRLAADHWGNGYAPEGARAALAFGFRTRDEIVSFTVPVKHASRRVMEKIGMTHDPSEDFDHPALSVGDPLRRHVCTGCDVMVGTQAALTNVDVMRLLSVFTFRATAGLSQLPESNAASVYAT